MPGGSDSIAQSCLNLCVCVLGGSNSTVQSCLNPADGAEYPACTVAYSDTLADAAPMVCKCVCLFVFVHVCVRACVFVCVSMCVCAPVCV